MNPNDIKNKIFEFIEKQTLTVIATVDKAGNKPESAVIGFAENEKLELFFGTSIKTRKYKNIQENKNVSFVIGWDGRVGTVQYEGVVEELVGEVAKEAAALLVKKNPYSAKFAQDPDHRYFKVTPRWVRIFNTSVSPNETHEISL